MPTKEEIFKKAETAAEWVFEHPWKSATAVLAALLVLTLVGSCVS